jgi:hypothetical protein
MTDSKPNLTEAARIAKAEREARAAQALRENLRKRKQQARARDAELPPAPEPDAPKKSRDSKP